MKLNTGAVSQPAPLCFRRRLLHTCQRCFPDQITLGDCIKPARASELCLRCRHKSSYFTHYVSDLSAADLLRAYRLMVLVAQLDERCWILHRQGKIAFTSRHRPGGVPRPGIGRPDGTTIFRITATPVTVYWRWA